MLTGIVINIFEKFEIKIECSVLFLIHFFDNWITKRTVFSTKEQKTSNILEVTHIQQTFVARAEFIR